MSSQKENILILFDGPHLAYSPTTIQLYDELSKQYQVQIIAQDAGDFVGQQLINRNVIYHPYNTVNERKYRKLFSYLKIVNKRCRDFKKNGLTYRDYFFKYLLIKKTIRKTKFSRIICIDNVNLYYCSLLGMKVDFLSLELVKDKHLLPLVDRRIINCVIIQSEERLQHLFPGESFRTFFVQNAPYYREITIPANRRHLIFAGSANEGFGFYKCLNYLNKYTEEVMVLQGALHEIDQKKIHESYQHLVDEKRLIINSRYIDNEEVVPLIAQYEIGFCFYDFEFPSIKQNHFNYYTAPSGKLFKYLAAGVPVVCINISGFKFVADLECGVLIDVLSEDEIRKAVLQIRSDYNRYVENCIRAAKQFSFDNAIQPYLEFIGFIKE